MKSTRLFLVLLPFFVASELLSVTRVLQFRTPVNSHNTVSSSVITLEGNETLEIISTRWARESVNYPNYHIGVEISYNDEWFEILGQENLKTDQSIKLEGPLSFRITGHSDYYSSSRSYWVEMSVFYNINPKEKEAPSKKFATVIPENSENNVSIILEQSTDLINWTTVAPGVFQPSTAKRFFRVRSEEE